ncbi:hypothetical protein [Sapientia aquatica]|uniref:Uncharacterized protein n=1 Tax=Sapientia aquatica TaxID=1549640 RepID=A0A4R5VPY9_9BURK|nr:hypothetical protein [Sapientia aquatica]TDK59587.1 hypothetical protein E2I14_18735 [Sapientia aquatica]
MAIHVITNEALLDMVSGGEEIDSVDLSFFYNGGENSGGDVQTYETVATAQDVSDAKATAAIASAAGVVAQAGTTQYCNSKLPSAAGPIAKTACAVVGNAAGSLTTSTLNYVFDNGSKFYSPHIVTSVP